MNCRCGVQIKDGEILCDRCKYYSTVFTPPEPVFESKREIAIRAMKLRKMTKQFRMVP